MEQMVAAISSLKSQAQELVQSVVVLRLTEANPLASQVRRASPGTSIRRRRAAGSHPERQPIQGPMDRQDFARLAMTE